MNRRPIAFTTSALLLIFTASSFGQTDPAGLMQPSPTAWKVQLEGSAMLEENGHIKKTDDDFRISIYESHGRWQLSNEHRINPTIGYSTRTISIDSSVHQIPDTLTDSAVAFGMPIVQFNNGWFLAGVVGVGYAGGNAFGQSDAYYGRATAVVGKELGPDSSLLVALDYDGNRAAFPDVPLPGFAYARRFNSTITGIIGFPYSAITWQPTPDFKAEVGLSIPDVFDARVEYSVTKTLRLIGNYQHYVEPFHIDGLPGHDRLIYEHRGIEAGLKFEPIKDLGILATVGYAFGQEFNHGWDSTDMDELFKVSDEAYFRLGLEWTF